ncbi:MAG: hypothetical protein QG670_2835 [Thermoproteota archaeon]|nr:hypothetical protein [Thermoproteota archaeon]
MVILSFTRLKNPSSIIYIVLYCSIKNTIVHLETESKAAQDYVLQNSSRKRVDQEDLSNLWSFQERSEYEVRFRP